MRPRKSSGRRPRASWNAVGVVSTPPKSRLVLTGRLVPFEGNGAATPIPGATVVVEGVVVGHYQGATQLSGFFLQEEDLDADADPATSEGLFVFCSACPPAVAEGQRVRVTGMVSEFFNMTQVTATTAGQAFDLKWVAITVKRWPTAGFAASTTSKVCAVGGRSRPRRRGAADPRSLRAGPVRAPAAVEGWCRAGRT
jgi:hypothetical protein